MFRGPLLRPSRLVHFRVALWLALLSLLPRAAAIDQATDAAATGARAASSRVASAVAPREPSIGPRGGSEGDRALREAQKVTTRVVARAPDSRSSPPRATDSAGTLPRAHSASVRLRAAGRLSRAAVADSGKLAYFPTAPPYQG